MLGTLLLLLPIAVGAAVMAATGAPPSRWAVHVGIGVIGALSVMAVRRLPALSSRVATALALIALVAIGAPLLAGDGLDGVRRWIFLGAFRVHPSALLGPALLVFVAAELRRSAARAHAILLVLGLLHIAQPDAGQATAFGLAGMMLAVSDVRRRALALAYGLLGAAAWLRADPLTPAPFVEDIVARAFALSPLVGAAAVAAALAGVLSARSMRAGDRSARAGELSLTTYFVASLAVPLVGEFPVPLLGFGSSPALGAFLGLGMLSRAHRREDARSREDDGADDVGRCARAALA